jgi:hypothetical protein
MGPIGTVVEVLDFNAYNIKMDGSGRVTKRNRQFFKPILPFNQVSQAQPTQKSVNTANTELQKCNISNQPANDFHLGPSVDSREASTLLSCRPSTGHPTAAKDKSGPVQVQAPDTQSVKMSDSTFDAGLSDAVRNVLNNAQQNKETRAEAAVHNRTKRVRFPTNRLIEKI